ncbi:MAG: DUF1559 domain-containing protein [Lentisphaerae bacterium]|nr:MAG: DUF1559 domain-containing protein [Lentisphaerota bacterium]
MKLHPKPLLRSFTLIELLVVIALIAILTALLLPALNRARSLAHLTACKTNQKQLALAFNLYTDDYSDYLPYSVWTNNGIGWFSWHDFLYPYAGKGTLTWDEIKRWYFPSDKRMEILLCPASRVGLLQPTTQKWNKTYVMPTKNWYSDKYVGIGSDGGSQEPDHHKLQAIAPDTILLTEFDSDYRYNVQGNGRTILSPTRQIQPLSDGHVSNPQAINYTTQLHPGHKLNYLIIDGHVEFLDPLGTEVIGNGDPDSPEGRWTVAAGD